MSKKLAKNVWVGGELYEAGSEPPKEVADQVTNPKAWEEEDEKSSASSRRSGSK